VQATAQSVSATLPHIKSGKLRPLVSFGGTRSKVLPDVPTLKELGYDVEYYLWVGLFAPKGTPPAIVSILRTAINKVAHGDAFAAMLVNLGLDLAYLDGPEFGIFWESDIKRIEQAVHGIGRV
jgi:tripartite-type tricarboxylate transporter receptor subunit TctC